MYILDMQTDLNGTRRGILVSLKTMWPHIERVCQRGNDVASHRRKCLHEIS